MIDPQPLEALVKKWRGQAERFDRERERLPIGHILRAKLLEMAKENRAYATELELALCKARNDT